MARLGILKALDMVQHFYNSEKHPNLKLALNVGGVQAYLLKDGTMILPGTNEPSDWWEFSLKPFSNIQADVPEIPGDSGALYHAGFLKYARVVFAFAKPLRPKFIAGHSLGAAAAQIVGASLGIPAIGFAAPRVTRTRRRLPGEAAVVSFCRTDDTVTQVPPSFMGFRHMGNVYWMSPPGVHHGMDHALDEYRDLMRSAAISAQLPTSWPV